MMVSETELVEAWFPGGVRQVDARARFEEITRGGREYRVLRLDGLTDADRARLVLGANHQLGRRYDWLQAMCFGWFRRFINDGPKRVICTRMLTEAFDYGLGRPLFPRALLEQRPGETYSRFWQLENGWVTPGELLLYSCLTLVVQPMDANEEELEFDDIELYQRISDQYQVATEK